MNTARQAIGISNIASKYNPIEMDTAVERSSVMVEKGIEDCRIIIAGSQELFNELMAAYIRKATGIECRSYGISDLSLHLDGMRKAFRGLILLDCHGEDPAKLCSDLREKPAIDKAGLYFCLFNVEPGKDMEIEWGAFRHGIRGIFYQDTPLTSLGKGILAVLAGELWFSREALTHCLLNQRHPNRREGSPGDAALTLREREILTLIASGLSNDKIALQLNLSVHTIKTHVFNIYKKINVPNRIQASLWVSRTAGTASR